MSDAEKVHLKTASKEPSKAIIYRWDLASPEVQSLSAGAFRIWVVLKAHVWTDKGYALSYAVLQDFTGYGRRTCQRHIEHLIEVGLLTRGYNNDSKSGDQQWNTWTLHDPPSVAASFDSGLLPEEKPGGWSNDHGGGWSNDHARVVKRPPIGGGQKTTLQGQSKHKGQGEDVQGKRGRDESAPAAEAPRDFLAVLRGGKRQRGTYPLLFRKATDQTEAEILHDLAEWALGAGNITPRDVGKRLARFKLEILDPKYRERVSRSVALTYGINPTNDSPEWRKLRHALSSGYKRASRRAHENVVSIVTQRLALIQKGDSTGVIRELARFRMEAA